MDAHRGPLAAGDRDQADAGKLRQLGHEPALDHVLHVGELHRLRGDAEREDRRVGRVDLGVDRRRRQVGGQQVAGRIDRRLHLLLGDVDGEVEPEAQRDQRGAAGTRRQHLRQVGHLPELPLQRRGDGGGHHLRAGAGIESLHLDRRIVDVRQRRQRQEPVGDDADQQDREHQQRSRHRPFDEQARRVHCAPSSVAFLPRPWRCWPLAGSPPPGVAAGRGAGEPDRRAVAQAVDAVGHHALAGGKAALDHCVAAVGRAGLHLPRLDRLAVLHDIDERPVLAELHGGVRRQHDVGQRVEQQLDVDELVGEQGVVGVRELRAQLERAGRGVDLIVVSRQIARLELLDVGAVERGDRQFAGRLQPAR